MRKTYLDNIRWVTVVLVVIYHVLYMYNAEGIVGTLGKITNLNVQYYDAYQYIVYPWFMMLLFIVSGASARYSLDKHTGKEFIKSRTTKLLVPTTVGLFVFYFIQGYININFSSVGGNPDIPMIGKVFACILSGIGVMWYLQMLWLFSLVIVLIKSIDRDRLWDNCKNTPFWALIIIGGVVYLAGQAGNTPIIVVYRFGLYFLAFLLGYFVFSHDEVIKVTGKYFPSWLVIALALGTVFTVMYFGQNYADNPIYRSPLFLLYGWFGCLAMIGGFARYFDFENGFTKWMSSHSWGLYLFHYLGISSVALFIAKPGLAPAWACYLLSLVCGFALPYGLYYVISRLPFFRWAVLGISKKTQKQVDCRKEQDV
ncbi:MAG: acyltransferase [Lachnospiraceae bacterium]|nr:acyltransferase [Lachnospiraceae bacterium]